VEPRLRPAPEIGAARDLQRRHRRGVSLGLHLAWGQRELGGVRQLVVFSQKWRRIFAQLELANGPQALHQRPDALGVKTREYIA